MGRASRESARGRTRFNPAASATELLAAVRAAALMSAAPTLVRGDSIGPFAHRTSLTRLVVREVQASAYRLLGEAELALASRLGGAPAGAFGVVLFDRAFNVVAFDRPVDLELALRANEAAARQRFDAAREDAGGNPPVICTLGVGGSIATVARPAFRDHRPNMTPWDDSTAAGGDERVRSPLYLVTDAPES